jgi:enoyl-CoA hydratase/carnithine racemase
MAFAEVEDRGAVRVVRFNRPEVLNAFNVDLYSAVTDALRVASADEAVHAVVLAGNGRAFSAGQDLVEMEALALGTAPEEAEHGFQGLLEVLQDFDKPLLAAVHGVGLGIGFTLLAHCDLVLVGESTRLRVPFAEMGVAPEAASSYLFAQRLGWQRAALVLLGGEWVHAEQAVAWGLALEVVPDGEVVARTVALAERVAAAPLASLRAIKRLMLAPEVPEIVAARDREEEAFATLLFGADAGAALARFNQG